MNLRTDVIGLLANAAESAKYWNAAESDKYCHDGGTAYALLELANNLRLLMRGEAGMAEWLTIYTGHEGEPLDIDELLPVPK